ncbi:MAG: hypothetical protein J7M38_14365, partial [Armatimonadetes bacterium]|nr:hypothetical protein [Armatimonadota bacterium]
VTPGAEVRIEVPAPPQTTWSAAESYRLSVRAGRIDIEAGGSAGAVWGLMTLIDLMRPRPDGGVSITAAEVEDAPAFPWRAGWASGPPAEAVNAIRKLVRLKMNVALIPATTRSQGEGDWEVIGLETCRAALRYGLTPVPVLIASKANPDGLALAAETVARNLPVDHIMVLYPGAWAPEAGGAILEAVEGVGRPITVISRLDAESPSTSQAAQTLSAWPKEVTAVVGLECVRSTELAEALWRAAGNGVSYLLVADEDPPRLAHLARSARAIGHRCLGLVAMSEDPEPVANAAWGGSG